MGTCASELRDSDLILSSLSLIVTILIQPSTQGRMNPAQTIKTITATAPLRRAVLKSVPMKSMTTWMEP